MYIFEKIEGEDNVYKFQTKKGFLYEIYFVEAPYYFPDNWQFKHQVYEFVVKLYSTPLKLKEVSKFVLLL